MFCDLNYSRNPRLERLGIGDFCLRECVRAYVCLRMGLYAEIANKVSELSLDRRRESLVFGAR